MSALRQTHPRVSDVASSALAGSSKPMRALARILAALGVFAAVCLVAVPWIQSSAGQGTVVALDAGQRRQAVDAPIDGRIASWHVTEGRTVKAGDPLFDIADNDADFDERLAREASAAQARLDAIRARASAIEGRIAALESSQVSAVQAAERRVSMARERKSGAGDAVRASEAAVAAATSHVERQRALAAKSLSSERTVELAEMDYARAVADLERARAAERAAEEEEIAARADRGKIEADGGASLGDARATLAATRAEEAAARAEIARVEVRQARQATRAVKAPRDGMVQRLMGGEGGEQVKSGETLLWLVPTAGDNAVELFISGNDVPLVHPGRRARLQFEGWPAVQWVGWPSIAVGTFGGVVHAVDAAAGPEGRFRVIVVPDEGAAWPDGRLLRQGARVTGWVLLDEVSLGWELWRQFNGFPPTAKPPETLDASKDDGGKSK